MHSIESRFDLGPSNILFGGVIVCTFQPGNFTGWGSEGVNQWVYILVGFTYHSPSRHFCPNSRPHRYSVSKAVDK